MNQSDFARLHGVSRKTITIWKSKGWVIFSGEDIDADASNALIEKYRKTVNHPKSKKTGAPVNKVKKGTVSSMPAAAAPELDPETSLSDLAEKFIQENGAELSLDEARRLKENYLALLTKLEFQQKDGQLIELEQAEKVLFDCFRAQRDSWLNWPSRVAPLMAADLDVPADRMTEVLAEHVHKHITSLGEPEFNAAEA